MEEPAKKTDGEYGCVLFTVGKNTYVWCSLPHVIQDFFTYTMAHNYWFDQLYKDYHQRSKIFIKFKDDNPYATDMKVKYLLVKL